MGVRPAPRLEISLDPSDSTGSVGGAVPLFSAWLINCREDLMEPKPLLPPLQIRTWKACAMISIAISAMLAIAASGWSEGPPANKPSPEAALQELLDGNKLYVADKNVRPDQRPSDAKQEPKAVILSCSDSRVSPTILFDQGIGSLFVIRTAGNTYSRLGLES